METWEYPHGEGPGRDRTGLFVLTEARSLRGIRVHVEADTDVGRAYYAVDRIGTFTICQDDVHTADGWSAPPQNRVYRLGVLFGRHQSVDWPYSPDGLPDEPIVNRVPLRGATTVDPASLPEEPHTEMSWPHARRAHRAPASSGFMSSYAPVGTQRRLWGILLPLIEHHMSLPAREHLDVVRARRKAPGRITQATRDLHDAQDALRDAQAQVDAAVARRREQSALLETVLPCG